MGELLIGGNLNYVSDSLQDRSQLLATVGGQPRKHRHCGGRFRLSDILDSFNLVDVWRALYPSARQYTFFSPVHQSYSRIDVLLASKPLFGDITSADIGIRSLSDHAWVTCLFAKRVTDGKGPNWMLNKSLLSDSVISDAAANEISNYFLLNKDCGVSSETVWDAFKAVIWGHFISVATSCKKAKLQIITDLKSKIAWLEERHRRWGGKRTLRKLELERKKISCIRNHSSPAQFAVLKTTLLFSDAQILVAA